jgi:hypothetical protein
MLSGNAASKHLRRAPRRAVFKSGNRAVLSLAHGSPSSTPDVGPRRITGGVGTVSDLKSMSHSPTGLLVACLLVEALISLHINRRRPIVRTRPFDFDDQRIADHDLRHPRRLRANGSFRIPPSIGSAARNPHARSGQVPLPSRVSRCTF